MKNLPAIRTRIVFERNEHQGVSFGMMLGVEEFIPAWWSSAGGNGPQQWCRRITYLQDRP